MKINWKVRLRNKVWLSGALSLVVTFVYDMLAMMEIVPPIGKDWVMNLVKTALTLLTMVGVTIDPTTPGAQDSDRAMSYITPGVAGSDTE